MKHFASLFRREPSPCFDILRPFVLLFCVFSFGVETTLAQLPLINGNNHLGNITTVQGIDVWTFHANEGDAIFLSIGKVGSSTLWPWIRLERPDGVEVGNSYNSSVAQINAMATISGTFKVLVGSNSGQGGNPFNGLGEYRLTLAKTPGEFAVSMGDQGGTLTNGVSIVGTIHRGDLDAWTIDANEGDTIILSAGDASGDLDPWIRLLQPDGTIMKSSSSIYVAQVELTNSQHGTYTVVIGSNAGQGNPFTGYGDYLLSLAKSPGDFVVSPGDQGGLLTNGINHSGSIKMGELDMWSFYASAGDHVSLEVREIGTTALWPSIRLMRPDGTIGRRILDSSFLEVNFTNEQAGVYTVVVRSDSGQGSFYTGSGDYQIRVNGTTTPVTLSTSRSGTNLTFVATGPANATCQLVTTMNLETPLGLWTPIQTNNFNSEGNLLLSWPIQSNEAERYFNLRVP
jgi:hypothetical protein